MGNKPYQRDEMAKEAALQLRIVRDNARRDKDHPIKAAFWSGQEAAYNDMLKTVQYGVWDEVGESCDD